MKILKIALAALLGIEALWVLASMTIRTANDGWHYPVLQGLLFVGLPLALLAAAVLQVKRPTFALLILTVLSPMVIMPLGNFVTVMSFLPFGNLIRYLPVPWQGSVTIAQNAVVVFVSLSIWLAKRNKIHNKTSEASFASAPQPQG